MRKRQHHFGLDALRFQKRACGVQPLAGNAVRLVVRAFLAGRRVEPVAAIATGVLDECRQPFRGFVGNLAVALFEQDAVRVPLGALRPDVALLGGGCEKCGAEGNDEKTQDKADNTFHFFGALHTDPICSYRTSHL
ncbi:MAG: hypothetical protein E5Y35_20480 [Mesorhizobium sp.]|nr:MAG: hypothetical protein E5Y35_20480 [Mesorhizobium sp.]